MNVSSRSLKGLGSLGIGLLLIWLFRTPLLFFAAEVGDSVSARALLWMDANPDWVFARNTAITKAVQRQDLKLLRMLLQSSVTTKAVDAHRTTSLHLAIRYGQTWNVRTLLTLGANPYQNDRQCRDALDEAMLNTWNDEVRILVDGGVDPNRKDCQGRTALDFAVLEDPIVRGAPLNLLMHAARPSCAALQQERESFEALKKLPVWSKANEGCVP